METNKETEHIYVIVIWDTKICFVREPRDIFVLNKMKRTKI
jgi:hypothetical protein